MRPPRLYTIPFLGLKYGRHSFEYNIGKTFFEERDYSIIEQGEVLVTLELDRKETMMIADFIIRGFVYASCDRCNAPIEVPLKASFKIIYKFGFEESGDESLIVLHPDAYELELYDTLYELITCSLPGRLTHKQGECNEEVLQLLSNYSDEDEEDFFHENEDEDED